MNPEVEGIITRLLQCAEFQHYPNKREVQQLSEHLRTLDRENAELSKDRERYLATLRFARLVLEECVASPTVQLAIKDINAAMKGGGE